MKKIILMLIAVVIILIVFKKTKEESIVIPDDAIRFRVLANSNSPRDQKIKEDIRNKMQEQLYNILSDVNTKKEAKNLIINNMSNFNNILNNKMKDVEYSYKIDYGKHYFPEKLYNGITYKEGNYESLLVTLGEGKGDNWWCVLFPPLCVLEAEETNTNDVEYKLFIKEIIKKYF